MWPWQSLGSAEGVPLSAPIAHIWLLTLWLYTQHVEYIYSHQVGSAAARDLRYGPGRAQTVQRAFQGAQLHSQDHEDSKTLFNSPAPRIRLGVP